MLEITRKPPVQSGQCGITPQVNHDQPMFLARQLSVTVPCQVSSTAMGQKLSCHEMLQVKLDYAEDVSQ